MVTTDQAWSGPSLGCDVHVLFLIVGPSRKTTLCGSLLIGCKKGGFRLTSPDSVIINKCKKKWLALLRAGLRPQLDFLKEATENTIVSMWALYPSLILMRHLQYLNVPFCFPAANPLNVFLSLLEFALSPVLSYPAYGLVGFVAPIPWYLQSPWSFPLSRSLRTLSRRLALMGGSWSYMSKPSSECCCGRRKSSKWFLSS